MKKLLLILSILVCGCSEFSSISDQSEIIRNPECKEDIAAFQVFQTLDDFVLANICRSEDSRNHCFGHGVYITKEKGKIYYDDQIIEVEKNKCVIFTGEYKYNAKLGERTVPKVEFIPSQIPNPEYKE